MPPRWPARTAIIPGAIGIDRRIFDDLEELIQSLRTGSREWQFVMNVAAQAMAKLSQGQVQMRYRGPLTDRKPWTNPIPRRTGTTYRGWYVRQIRPGIWALTNETRGAYAVEYGLASWGVRGVARKPLKRSAIATLGFIARTRFANRICHETFGQLKNNKGHFQSTAQRMRGSNLLGVSGPQGPLP